MVTQDGTIIVGPNFNGKVYVVPPKRPKPPAETKAQLMLEIRGILINRNRADALDFLLNFFTAADLVGIRDELKGNPRD